MKKRKPLWIAHMIAYTGRAQGGPVMSMSAMSTGLIEEGNKVTVFSVKRSSDGAQAPFHPQVDTQTEPRSFLGSFRYSPALWSRVKASRPHVVHSHGLWTDIDRQAWMLSRLRNIPHLLAPCGTLQKKALQRSWWKKLPVRWVFQDRALREAACLHAKSEAEYEGIRRFGLRNPIAILPNPVLGPSENIPPRKAYCETFKVPEERKQALYLGRIHPVKGLDALLHAWGTLKSFHQEWVLILAGPDEGGYRAVFGKPNVLFGHPR